MSKERATVTEKIDGSNSCIRIRPAYDEIDRTDCLGILDGYVVWAQSRSRFLQPTKQGDNFGFAKWVDENAAELIDILGPGDHYGEWWGSGIQRGYGLKEKRFSLFNAPRWNEILHPTEALSTVPNLYIVPTLFAGSFYDLDLPALRDDLTKHGSKAMLGWKAEGMVVYLRELNASYKVLLEGDTIHKWEAVK
jgi:hypothetical protein